MHVWICLTNVSFPLWDLQLIEAYHLEAISHHSAPNWTVCLLHFHFPLPALSASLRDRPEKWHSLRLIEHPQAQTKLTEPHTGATHGCLDSLLLLCLLVKKHRRQREGQEEGGFGWDWLRENFFTLVVKDILLLAIFLMEYVHIEKNINKKPKYNWWHVQCGEKVFSSICSVIPCLSHLNVADCPTNSSTF